MVSKTFIRKMEEANQSEMASEKTTISYNGPDFPSSRKAYHWGRGEKITNS